MRILLTGATGFVGRAIVAKLHADGHAIAVLSRDPHSVARKLGIDAEAFAWDAMSGPPPEEALAGVDVVIHLAGESIAAGRWTEKAKGAILDSRVRGTRNLVAGLNRLSGKIPAFLSASAVGFYGDTGEDYIDESAPRGAGFLASVCDRWETEARLAPAERIGIFRFGLVLGPGGGALAKMLPLFRMGLGGPLGSGKQWMSWIQLDDLVGIFREAVADDRFSGIINCVAPETVRNAEFAHTLGEVLERPAIVPTPAFALRFAFGEMADEALLASQRVNPGFLLRTGFSFRHPTLFSALTNSLR